MKGLGDYTIPADNKFQADGDPKTLGEIYAYGFRNAHRLAWDLTDGALFVGDIGMNHIEEVNIVRNGGNYGWMKREGYWENGMIRPGGALNQLYELPGDVLRTAGRDEFIYPVAIYDHNEGVAVTGGFPYHGRIEALRGKLIFGDVNRGRLFAVDVAARRRPTTAFPRPWLRSRRFSSMSAARSGQRIYTSFRELVEGTMGTSLTRTDLHLSRSRDGEIFLTSRQDGMIRMLVPDSGRSYRVVRSPRRRRSMAENPYAAPRTHVEDAPTSFPDGDFHSRRPRCCRAGKGWRWIADAWAFTGEQRWTFIGVFLLLCLMQIAANFVPIIGPLAVTLLSRCCSAGSCSVAMPCAAASGSRSATCSRAFSGIPASSWGSVRSRSRSASSLAIIMSSSSARLSLPIVVRRRGAELPRKSWAWRCRCCWPCS